MLLKFTFTSGGLHEKHVVASWKVGNRLSICFQDTGKPRKNLYRGCNYFPQSQWPIRHYADCVSSKKYEINFTRYGAQMNFLQQMVLLLFRYRHTKNNVQSMNALPSLLVTHHTVTTLQRCKFLRGFPSRHWEISWHRIRNKKTPQLLYMCDRIL